MLKIRRPLGRLIFNMGIAIPGKTVFLIETAPCVLSLCTHQCICNVVAHMLIPTNVSSLSHYVTTGEVHTPHGMLVMLHEWYKLRLSTEWSHNKSDILLVLALYQIDQQMSLEPQTEKKVNMTHNTIFSVLEIQNAFQWELHLMKIVSYWKIYRCIMLSVSK